MAGTKPTCKCSEFATPTYRIMIRRHHKKCPLAGIWRCDMCGECKQCGQDVGKWDVEHKTDCSLAHLIPSCDRPASYLIHDKNVGKARLCLRHNPHALDRLAGEPLLRILCIECGASKRPSIAPSKDHYDFTKLNGAGWTLRKDGWRCSAHSATKRISANHNAAARSHQ